MDLANYIMLERLDVRSDGRGAVTDGPGHGGDGMYQQSRAEQDRRKEQKQKSKSQAMDSPKEEMLTEPLCFWTIHRSTDLVSE